MRFTTAKLAVMLDNLRQDEVRLLHEDTEALEAALRAKKTEIQALASVIKNARRHDRHVETFAHSAIDIFDLLDEAVIQSEFPRFPGHLEAQAQFDGRPNEKNRKVFYEAAFEVPRGLETYDTVANEMRRGGTFPKELVEVVDGLELYALSP